MADRKKGDITLFNSIQKSCTASVFNYAYPQLSQV